MKIKAKKFRKKFFGFTLGKPPLSNERGFSLMEVMIGSAMAGVIALAIMSTNQTQNKSNRRYRLTNQVEDIVRSIQIVMSNQATCNANFVVGSDPPQMKYSNRLVHVGDSGEVTLLDVALNSTYQSRGYTVGKIDVVQSVSTGFYDIEVEFSILADVTRTVNRRIPLQFEFDSLGRFSQCYSHISHSTNTIIREAVDEACTTAGLQADVTTDPTSPRCAIDTSQATDLECTNPLSFIQKIELSEASGNIRYQVTCDYLIDPTTCGSGRYAVIRNGSISCSNTQCASGELGIYANGDITCYSMSCPTSPDVTYLQGINQSGPICRTFVSAAQNNCAQSVSLKTDASGTLYIQCGP
jgi:prepilin-type N-terminal cleavage/methylation domain-containing protein